MLSSGITATTTSNDNAVTLAAESSPQTPYNRVLIHNTGSNSGFFSIDNGRTWGFLHGATAANMGIVEWLGGPSNSPVLVKRIPGGGNLGGVYGFVDYVPSTLKKRRR